MQHCQHIFANGYTCRAIALKNQRFCYFHTATRDRVRRQRIAARRNLPFQLPILENRPAIQLAIGDVINAMFSGRLDRKTAALTLYALQIASSNLKGTKDFPADYSYKEYSPELDGSLPEIEPENHENLPENADFPLDSAEIPPENAAKSERIPPKKPVQSAPRKPLSDLAKLVKKLNRKPTKADLKRMEEEAAEEAKRKAMYPDGWWEKKVPKASNAGSGS